MFCLRRIGWNVSYFLATILSLRATNLLDFERTNTGREYPDVRIKVVSCREDSRPKTFDKALGEELAALIREAKSRAARYMGRKCGLEKSLIGLLLF
jgi:hypothetical protein